MRIRLFMLLLFTCFVSVATANEVTSTLRSDAEVIGVAQAASREPAFDQQLKGKLDSLVPRLKKMGPDAAILIEAYYPPDKTKKNDDHVRKAYLLAEQAQLYLRNRHSLPVGIFISIWSGGVTPEDKPQLRLTSYPKAFFEN